MLDLWKKLNILRKHMWEPQDHLTAGQWVKKTQMEKSQSLYGLVWSPVFFPVFFLFKSLPFTV